VRLEEVAQFKLYTHGQLADNGCRSFVVSFAAPESVSASADVSGSAASLGSGFRPLDSSSALGFAQLQGLCFVYQLQRGTAVGGTGAVWSRQLAKVQAMPATAVMVTRRGTSADGGATGGAGAAGQGALRDQRVGPPHAALSWL